MPEYDVAVIGSGTAAQNVAPRCAQAGLRVAVVDRLPYGGTCAQRGCDPKKVLLAAAEAVSRARMLDGRGLVGSPTIDWPALIARKRTFTAPVPERIEGWMRGAGAETMHGAARLLGPHEVDVDGRAFDAADVVVASGARPMDLGIPGEELVTTSDRFLELDVLPPRIVFIGGGYISFEFAWLSRMAGAAVTIIHRGDHVLKGFDEVLAGMLAERYRSLGIDVVTGAPVHEVRRRGGELLVVHGAGEHAADLVVHGAGRVADVAGLGLEEAGIEVGRAGRASRRPAAKRQRRPRVGGRRRRRQRPPAHSRRLQGGQGRRGRHPRRGRGLRRPRRAQRVLQRPAARRRGHEHGGGRGQG